MGALLAGALVVGCQGPAGDEPFADPGYSLYALVTTIDGTSFGPPLGPPIAATGTFDSTLLDRLRVVLEAEDAAGHVSTLGDFGAATNPGLVLLGRHELYWMNVPAAAYFTDPGLAYRFRALLDGREIGRSDMSSKIFEVMSWVPTVPVGVKLRIERRPAPTLERLTPATLVAGAADLTLTIHGAGFVHDSVVRFGALELATSWASSGELTAVVPASALGRIGRTDVTVVTLAPGGGTSAALPFVTLSPTPVLTDLTPSHVVRGSADLGLTLTGADFLAGARATFGGASLETTFVSSTTLIALVPASALASAAEVAVRVVNPDPGGPSAPLAFDVENPVPAIVALTPASVTAGAASFLLTISGRDFASDARVTLAGAALAATFVSDTTLTAIVPASALAAAGTFAVVVENAAPGGGRSHAVDLTVANPTPSLTAITPSSATRNGAAFTLTLGGAGFLAGASATLGGTTLATTYVSSAQLTAIVPSSLLTNAGSLSVVVTNPAPTAGPSAPRTFTVDNPTPSLTSMTPASAAAGAGTFTLTLNGASFVTGAVATFAGTSLTTTFVSSTQVTATVPAALVAAVGTFSVTAVNPAPTPGASAALSFAVNNPVPTSTSLSPASAFAGAAQTTLTVNGSGFNTSSAVTFNGASLATTFVSSARLTATIPSASLSLPGSFNVTVVNPAPGGGTSATLVFAVTDPYPRTLATFAESYNTNCGVRNGLVYCAGSGIYGETGNGTRPSIQNQPVQVAGLSDVIEVVAGQYTLYARASDGSVWAWGLNNYAQVGDGTTTNRLTPVRITAIGSVAQVSGGNSHACARSYDGTVRCWGRNTSGQLGNGGTTDSSTPVLVSGLTNVVEISGASGDQTCARRTDSTIWCWGAGTLGQLGNGVMANSSVPVQVSNISTAAQIAGGRAAVCARLTDGTVRCWGYNYNCQLGDGTQTNRSTPVSTGGLTNVVDLSVGWTHSCAVRGDGTVRCWGAAGDGEVGNGNGPSYQCPPAQTSGISTGSAVAAGNTRSCARLSDGSGRCWGNNVYGQLGDGTTTTRYTPVSWAY